jgi:hypothetical protein
MRNPRKGTGLVYLVYPATKTSRLEHSLRYHAHSK